MSAQQGLALYPGHDYPVAMPRFYDFTKHRRFKDAPSELQEKRDAKRRLDIMRYRDIRRAASCARQIWHRKNALHIEIEGHVVVCIDEVRTLLGINPVKNGKENNYLGCTFTARIPRKNKWRKVPGLGMHSSTVRGSHGNSQTLWEMTEEKWPVEK